jgi:ferredoxin-NADP reductase
MRSRIRTVKWETDGVNSYVLEPLDEQQFPSFFAGAHIDVHLSTGMQRSYTLLNDQAETGRYEIGVQIAPESRGGSRFIHENWRVGQIVDISPPRNNFPLVEDASATLLIAGGIGITPMLAMIARLETLGRPWTLHYAAKTRERAAFLDRLRKYHSGRVTFHDDAGGTALDMTALLRATAADTHIYCCGPEGMLNAFCALTASRPVGYVHLEHFSGTTDLAIDGGYTLELRRSGKTIEVVAGETMLDSLLNAGVNVGFACSEGVCGSCKVTVLDGIPDHRDRFLTPEERNANQAIMVCCSGTKTPMLALDL